MSTLQLNNDKVEVHEWTLKIPPRSRLVSNFNVAKNASYRFSEIKFTTGVLSQYKHNWSFEILPDLSIVIKLAIKGYFDSGFSMISSELQTLQGTCVKSSFTFDFPMTDDLNYFPWSQDWATQFKIPNWDDTADALKVVFKLQFERVGELIESKAEPALFDQPKLMKDVDWRKYFLSQFLSDVTIVAKDGKKLPAHRLMLSSRSPVFERMFQNDMKETQEGLVKIDDIEPEVLEETLYYMYTGDVSKEEVLKVMCVDLLKSANKYELEDLKNKCAKQIASSITFENAVEIYILGDTYNVPGLMQLTKDVMKRDKVKVFKDSDAARELFIRCPQLAFELMGIN